jgi:hypothetical protein
MVIAVTVGILGEKRPSHTFSTALHSRPCASGVHGTNPIRFTEAYGPGGEGSMNETIPPPHRASSVVSPPHRPPFRPKPPHAPLRAGLPHPPPALRARHVTGAESGCQHSQGPRMLAMATIVASPGGYVPVAEGGWAWSPPLQGPRRSVHRIGHKPTCPLVSPVPLHGRPA